jgi:hypothetical protein
MALLVPDPTVKDVPESIDLVTPEKSDPPSDMTVEQIIFMEPDPAPVCLSSALMGWFGDIRYAPAFPVLLIL